MTYAIPRLNANEDQLHLVKLCVSVGQAVAEGQPLFIVESTKASFEVAADQAGTVAWVSPGLGRLLDVGTEVVRLQGGSGAPGGSGVPAAANHSSSGPASPVQAPGAGDSPRKATAKERLLQRRAAAEPPAPAPARGPAAVDPSVPDRPFAAPPWVSALRARLGGVEASPTERTWTGPLTGPLQETGLHLEAGAVLETGARLIARRAWLGREARVAAGTTLHATDLLIGDRARILGNTDLFSGEILIEDGAFLSTRIQGDVSGGMNPDSRLLVGGASIVGSEAFLNTCHEILIEREAAVSPRAMLFTHSFWQSILDGYQPLFGPIRIAEQAWVGAGCQILPGITVGSGSIVTSNSTVVADVRPGTLVAGIPARETRSGLGRELPAAERTRLLLRLVEDFARLAADRGCTVRPSQGGFELAVERADIASRRIILIPAGPTPPPRTPLPPDSLLLWDRDEAPPAAAAVFNLRTRRFDGTEDRVAHLLRNVLRRRGIRLQPYDWDGDFRKGL